MIQQQLSEYLRKISHSMPKDKHNQYQAMLAPSGDTPESHKQFLAETFQSHLNLLKDKEKSYYNNDNLLVISFLNYNITICKQLLKYFFFCF